MNVLAFLLAVGAGLVFALSIKPRHPAATVATGLVLLTAAWIVQLVWQTPHIVRVG